MRKRGIELRSWVASGLAMGVAALWAATLGAGAADFHVAADGSDTNPGTADHPFLTLQRARDAARLCKKQGRVISIAVSGTCRLTGTLELDERDSGTHFVAEGKSRISGGLEVPVQAVKPVSDPAILGRLLPEVRNQVKEIDVRALGIDDFGEIGPRGFGRSYLAAPMELLIDDEPLSISRWPKAGCPGEPIGKVLDQGTAGRSNLKPPRGGTFEFASMRPFRWKLAGDVWLTGFFMNGYADDTLRVMEFNYEKKTLTTEQPHGYGFCSTNAWNRWVALNLLEEIGQPGEFMADRKTGKLYFLPPADKDMAMARLELTIMKEPLIAIEGATNVVFDGIDIECSRGTGVFIERGCSNRIQNATLRNLGMVAVCIGQGTRPGPRAGNGAAAPGATRVLGPLHGDLSANPGWNRQAGTGQGVFNCRIYNIGAGAILLGGGDRLRLTPAGNAVENCDIHHFNRWERTYRTAVNIDGVGNIIRHCRIHDCPGGAILLHGNDHLIEYNEIFNAMLEGDDMGAFYMGRDPTERGNIIRYNHWHDLARHHRNFALYFDDSGGDGTLVYGNIFRDAGTARAININGGSDIRVINNIFIGQSPIFAKPRGKRHISEALCEAKLKAVRFDQSPWREHYPGFANYLAERSQMPRGILFATNVVVRAKLLQSDSLEYKDNKVAGKEPDLQQVGLPGFQPIPFDRIGRQGAERRISQGERGCACVR